MPDGPNKNISRPPVTDPSRPEVVQHAKRLVIDAPEYLSFGQNLYDQSPFDGVVRRLQGGLRLDESYESFYRLILTKSLSNPDFTKPVYGWQQVMSTGNVTRTNVMRILDDKQIPYKRLSRESRPWVATVIAAEILALLEFPFIGEYVRNQTEPPQSAYSKSGIPYSYSNSSNFKFDERSQPSTATKSYARWLSDQVQREGRMLSLEVRSVIFADDETSPASAARKSGHRKGWRRWAILKSTEIKR